MKQVLSFFCFFLFINSVFSQSVFRFIGNGNWTLNANWQNGLVPPDSLYAPDTIYISPATAGACILNKQQTILPGGTMIITDGTNFIITGGIILSDFPKLKKIIYPADSFQPVCSPVCPISVSQQTETFLYNSFNQLAKRVLIKTSNTDSIFTSDTTDIYEYFYSNSTLITSYTHKNWASPIIINHILQYDNQNRLILDSIINPQEGNNKLTHFSYSIDTVFEYEKQTYTAGTQIRIDTMLLSGNNVFKVNRSLMSWQHIFAFSSYRNPLSYVNNFGLMATDRKNAGYSDIFMIYNPEFINYNQVSEDAVKYISSGTITEHNDYFSITTDIFNRVQTVSNTASGNRVTTFEYY